MSSLFQQDYVSQSTTNNKTKHKIRYVKQTCEARLGIFNTPPRVERVWSLVRVRVRHVTQKSRDPKYKCFESTKLLLSSTPTTSSCPLVCQWTIDCSLPRLRVCWLPSTRSSTVIGFWVCVCWLPSTHTLSRLPLDLLVFDTATPFDNLHITTTYSLSVLVTQCTPTQRRPLLLVEHPQPQHLYELGEFWSR